MSRRTSNDEIEFGSDSFLDVVANIVGILIILIVIAGVRVSTVPVGEPSPPAAAPAVAPAVADVPEPQPLRALEPSPELVRQADRLKMELDALASQRDGQAQELTALAARELQSRAELEAVQARLAASRTTLSAEQQRAAELEQSTAELRSRLGEAQRQLEAAERVKIPVRQIKHRLTPISRAIEGPEVHFHLAGGRIAPVPVEELVERLKSQISRHKDWLAKSRRHQGEVGPIHGFSMLYVVERESFSAIEDVRHGGNAVMRIGVSEWQLRPEPSLRGETAAEALRPGSAYIRALRMAEPNAALTFWVYPDSFELYRAVQSFAYDEGFTVAARPLPFGLPIAGSPNGSRSAGQ